MNCNQFGFVESRSTNNAIFKSLNYIYERLDGRNCVRGIYFDPSQAIDKFDHYLLRDKLYCYGVRRVCLDEYRSHLSDRSQTVVVGQHSESHSSISTLTGVKREMPQGSILRPLLFLVGVNDLYSSSPVSNIT